jgi:hypothetical protein
MRQPSDGRVIGEHSLDEQLQQFDQLVVSPHMSQFMYQNRFPLRKRQLGHRIGRYQNETSETPDNDRSRDQHRLQQADVPRDPHVLTNTSEGL